MNKSLYTKLVLVMLALILCIMSVVAAFLINEVRAFYLDDFYQKMKSVFESPELAEMLYSAADEPNAPTRLDEIVKAHTGQLGIDFRNCNYYILAGDTGSVLSGSAPLSGSLTITPNILTAIGGSEGYKSDPGASYMDVAFPIKGRGGSYIIYIIDNKNTAQNLSTALFAIIGEAIVAGLVLSVLLSLLLAKTIVTPIQSLTKAAERVAAGDFSRRLQSGSKDEIGVLTSTFSEMAQQLEKNLDDLTRSEQMRREFVANVSHELRTPITSIRSYAETLQDSEELPPKTRDEFLGVILKESDRMTKIVQDLLTLSRFDAGSFSFTFERFSFEKSIMDVYNAMHLEAQRRHHRFNVDIKTDLPEIVGDRARLEQVLINFVSNSIKYTSDGGKITITAGAKDDRVWVSVRDNGIGIPLDDVSKVFDRFYRVDKARSRESGGTGLGLSIASEIVNRHNGNIELVSRVGKGTVITMSLPTEGPTNG